MDWEGLSFGEEGDEVRTIVKEFSNVWRRKIYNLKFDTK